MFKKNKKENPSIETQEEAQATPVVPKQVSSKREHLLGSLLFGALIVVVCLGLFGAGFGAFTLWQQQSLESQAPSISGLSTAEITATQESVPSMETPEKEEVTSVAPEASDDLKKAQGLDVIVMNGGGAKGVATEAADFLKKESFTKVTVGNTKGDFSGTVLYYKKGQEKEAEVVKSKLATKYTNLTSKEALASDTETQTATITVIFGK